MSIKQTLQAELEYTEWANRILLDILSQLSEEELRRNLGASHTSLIRTMRHIYDAERAWTHGLMSGSLPSVAEMDAAGAADQSRPDSTFEALQQGFPAVWADARRWLEPLNEDDLAKELTCVELDGTPVLIPQWKIILHMVNHSTLHRGQIITMLRAIGKRPSNLDMFTHYRLR